MCTGEIMMDRIVVPCADEEVLDVVAASGTESVRLTIFRSDDVDILSQTHTEIFDDGPC